jgi:DMSO/TMAO reductase YedYZ molybdopterin-dependent catalytic subunit
MEIREALPLHPVPDGKREPVVGDVLSVDGLVGRRLELTHADLAQLPRAALEEPFVCEEGWSVPGLRWGGVRLSDIVALAQPLAAATYVRAGSGPWVVPIPLSDAAAVLVCDQLNGEPLTVEHGAPWRLVPSGGPCFSNVKWLDRLELTAEPGEHDAERIARARLDLAKGAV